MEDFSQVIEVSMPVDAFWDVQEAFKELHYLQAANENQAEIMICLKRVFEILAPFAVLERHRAWLRERAHE